MLWATGIYWSETPNNRNGGSAYIRQNMGYSDHGGFWSWPSITQTAAALRPRNRAIGDIDSNTMRLTYDSQRKTYCFVDTSSRRTFICAENSSRDDGENRFYPPKYATWKYTNNEQTSSLRIRHFNFYKSYYFQKEEKPFQQLFQRPATCLLLGLNIALAFAYWNYRVSPDRVALQDGPILQQHQYWRAITGALAHFEWWHLMFNMMSLHNLGQFLEPMYGSIHFLLYNLSLIPLTAMIFLGGIHALRWYDRRNNIIATRLSVNAVGYSAVLFAWMVVASLEQTKSCPVPFFDNLCFETWNITTHIRFNLGPLIQLVIAQLILPRVSLGGHLAGIIAGFWLHWNLLPLELIQPSVLIPLLLLVQWKIRHFMPMQHGASDHGEHSARNLLDISPLNDEDETGQGQPSQSSILHQHWFPFNLISHREKATLGMTRLLSCLLLLMLLLLISSLGIMSWGSSLIYSQGLLSIMFYFCCLSYNIYLNDGSQQDFMSTTLVHKKERMIVLWKGFIVSCVLVLVMDSMTLACWSLMGNAMFSPLIACIACSVLGTRLLTYTVALSLACKTWEDLGGANDEKGIFEYSLGYCILSNGVCLGQRILSLKIVLGGCQRHATAASPTFDSRSTSTERSTESGLRDRDKAKTLAAAAAERRARGTIQEPQIQ